MRCPNPNCNAELLPSDRHCPMCGTAVGADGAQDTAESAGTQVVATTQQRRVGKGAVQAEPIAEEGESYPALRQKAHLSVASGSTLRWLLTGLGVLLFVLCLVSGAMSGSLLVGFVLGVLFLAGGCIGGWLLWLRLAVYGEMIYLILDAEETFRRGVARRE